jgi:hypothetical protein
MRLILIACGSVLIQACAIPDYKFQPLVSTFTASPSPVDFGQTSTLSWTLAGRATSLTLDGRSVLGTTSSIASPVRRQTYVLAATNDWGQYRQNLVVAARGVDLFAGNLQGRGNLDTLQ